MKKIKNIAILGDGGWGTTLAIHLSEKNYIVRLWGAFPAYIKKLKKSRINSKFLPGVRIPKSIEITENIKNAVDKSELIVLATPAQYARGIIRKIQKLDLSGKIILSVVKGVETKSLLRISQIVEKELNKSSFAVLSGPTIATEVVRGIPSTAVIASRNIRIAKKLQRVFNSERLRIYTNRDVVGVELGGSIKNIIAIACGLCDGLKFGANTKAALLSRGLVEMGRLGAACGGKAKTFSGLSGLGDLVTTCFSPESRNRYVGEQLGLGNNIKKITSSMDMVAEGITTVKAINALRKKHDVSMPITSEVYNIIYNNKKPQKAVADLMGRKLKNE